MYCLNISNKRNWQIFVQTSDSDPLSSRGLDPPSLTNPSLDPLIVAKVDPLVLLGRTIAIIAVLTAGTITVCSTCRLNMRVLNYRTKML